MTPTTDRGTIHLVILLSGVIGILSLVGCFVCVFAGKDIPEVILTIPTASLTGILALLASTRSNPDPTPVTTVNHVASPDGIDPAVIARAVAKFVSSQADTSVAYPTLGDTIIAPVPPGNQWSFTRAYG